MIGKKSGIFVASLVLLGALSCKKENNSNQVNSEVSKLPPITQTGAGTLGYLANNNAVVCNKISCSFVQTTQLTTDNYFSFTLIAVDSTSTSKQTISVYIPGTKLFTNNTIFALNGPPNVPVRWFAGYSSVATNGYTDQYQTTYPTVEQISFANPFTISKIDTTKKIFSGTFSLNMTDNSNTPLSITEGRFDVHYTSN